MSAGPPSSVRSLPPRRGVDLPVPARLPLLVLAFVALALGTAAGLARTGVAVTATGAALQGWHAVLMVCGFFGTLISLERAVAHARLWAYAAPLLSVTASLLLLSGAPVPAAALAFSGAALVLTAVSALMAATHRASYTLTLAIGAAAWLAGNLLWWQTGSVAPALSWWAAFLVLTIAGERLELSRLRPPSPAAARLFALLVAGWLAAAAAATVSGAPGWRALGAVIAATGVWLVVNDIARYTIRGKGVTRYMAVCLLSGYGWLMLAGAVLVLAAEPTAGFAWDASLHALMLGFVFSMVFAHAPVILPAVTRLPVAFHAGFYLPLALLHASLALRIAGDLSAQMAWRQWGAAANAVTLLLFVAAVAAGVLRGRSASASSRS
jgi:hypothetical protein